MKLLFSFVYLTLFFALVYFSISCKGSPSNSQTATLDVLVVDNDPQETPIPDVEITITPGNIIQKTSLNGTCRFILKPGDYYVNAHVCCAGSRYIPYHEPVSLGQNELETIKLIGCLSCK